jgi:hypothetical protein
VSPKVYEAQRRVERRLAAAGNVPEPTEDKPVTMNLTPEAWTLAFAGTGLDPDSVTLALSAALSQMAPHGAVGASFWLGYELGAQR